MGILCVFVGFVFIVTTFVQCGLLFNFEVLDFVGLVLD